MMASRASNFLNNIEDVKQNYNFSFIVFKVHGFVDQGRDPDWRPRVGLGLHPRNLQVYLSGGRLL